MSNIQIDSTHPVVSRLIELQGSQSDRAFSDASLTISETVWYRIKAGKYQADDHSRVLKKLTGDLSSILDRQAMTANVKTARIIPLSHITDSRDALNMAFAEDRNRIVIVLADTGGGKTMIAKSIARDFATRTAMVEATEAWRKSYLAGIQGIARGVGIADPSNNTRKAEFELLNHLAKNPRIVVIDEGNYFGAACLNLIKAICNQTQSIVVILSMPVLWQFINRQSQQEARQLRNRAAAILEVNQVKKKDVAIAMAETVHNWSTLNGATDTAVAAVCAAANNFGLWNTVFSIATFVTEEAGAGDLTLDIVQSAIADVQKLRR